MLIEFALIAMFDGHQREVKVFQTAAECAEVYAYLNNWVGDARREARLASELALQRKLIDMSYAKLEKANPKSSFITKFTLKDVIEAAQSTQKWDEILAFAKTSDMISWHDENYEFVDFSGDAKNILHSVLYYRQAMTEVENLKSTYADFSLPFPLNFKEPRLPDHEMLPKSVEYTCLPIPK